jgi:hypothetical protein
VLPLNLPVQGAVDRSVPYAVYLVETRRVKDERGLVVFLDGLGGHHGAPPGDPPPFVPRLPVRQAASQPGLGGPRQRR